MQFTVGLKLKGKTDHIAVNAEDALIAAPLIEEQCRWETNFDGKFERSVVATAVYPLKRAQCSPI